MPPQHSKIKQMALVSLMTAVICVLAPFSLTLPTSPVPISMGNMVVCFAVIVLGMKHGLLSVFLYLFLGLIGLPVFSNFTGGIGKLLGPTGGYLIGYLLLALLLGLFMERYNNRMLTNVFGAVMGMLLLYFGGTVWLAFQMQLDFMSALWVGVIPYIPMDCIKIALSLIIGSHLRKQLSRAGLI